jgi:hypothetical protein
MEIEDALFAWAKQQATLAAVLQEADRFRLYKVKQPQGTKLPSVTINRDGAGRQALYCGIDGAVRVQLRVDHFAADWPTMANLAKRFRLALLPDPSPYPLWMGDGNSPGVAVRVKSVHLENEFDADDIEPGTLRRVQQWTFWIHQPSAT